MVILTLNCGSSSVKYQVYDWDAQETLATGIVERVTQEGSGIEHKAKGKAEYTKEHACPTHDEAIELIIETIQDPEWGVVKDISEIKAVGHRTVHGGERFAKSTIIDDAVLNTMKELSSLAPLHNPANIMGIEAAQKVLPKVPHCGIMDTAWHQTMPKEAYLYALPYEWYEKHGVRRYGFHGTSFLYTAKRAAALLKKNPFETNLIIAHIGNGASINAVKNGISIDTSMGLTPLEGLVMGTRCGDIDPAIPIHIMKQTGMSAEEVEKILNKKSGVLGVSQKWVDRRDIEQNAWKGNETAIMTQNIEAYRLKKYIGAYAAALGRVDAVVFTAGVGERGPDIRFKSTEDLENLGIKIDADKNQASMTRNAETEISADDSPVKIFVIPTDEELVMTEDTYALVNGSYDVHTNYTYSFQSEDYVNRSRLAGLDKDLKKWDGLDNIIVSPRS
ncbi:MAG: acetate kinase [Spirochaetales bacterium]|nr:acetate kinase [Spirochaetales bacterium]MCF7937879.1 acetate kinase [Spirochaetales bacterium]